MKLITSNGEELSVRDVGPVILCLKRKAGGLPIKLNGTFLLEDDEARNVIRKQLDLKLYDRV